jgi:hypothetical protein
MESLHMKLKTEAGCVCYQTTKSQKTTKTNKYPGYATKPGGRGGGGISCPKDGEVSSSRIVRGANGEFAHGIEDQNWVPVLPDFRIPKGYQDKLVAG